MFQYGDFNRIKAILKQRSFVGDMDFVISEGVCDSLVPVFPKYCLIRMFLSVLRVFCSRDVSPRSSYKTTQFGMGVCSSNLNGMIILTPQEVTRQQNFDAMKHAIYTFRNAVRFVESFLNKYSKAQ